MKLSIRGLRSLKKGQYTVSFTTIKIGRKRVIYLLRRYQICVQQYRSRPTAVVVASPVSGI